MHGLVPHILIEPVSDYSHPYISKSTVCLVAGQIWHSKVGHPACRSAAAAVNCDVGSLELWRHLRSETFCAAI